MSGYGEDPYGYGPYGGTLVEEPPIVPARLVWNLPADRQYETGLDRGVLYPKDAPAVAWNGLTAVEEEGGESSTTYYMDGRPFLHLPVPKEFAATLKAYTYPDEFSPMMGVAEAADGLYLDSQMGDSFDLSYRTKIGNVITENLGYKIHLVYNATVAPTQISYTTQSESINPNEFSWSIQAVPGPVVGYRPTAHIIIDTRHMDPFRLATIEELLYGTEFADPVMPSAQDVFDILSFGNTIIITDHGDGTWSAEGSYSNVYSTGPDTFQIDNVEGVDNADGTFDVSTTNA